MSKDNFPFGHGVPDFGSDGTERLEETLRAQAPGVASQEFRSGLKRSFVDGDMAGQEAAPELVSKRLVDVLDSKPTPAPDPEFRSKMRGLFLGQETVEKATPEAEPGLARTFHEHAPQASQTGPFGALSPPGRTFRILPSSTMPPHCLRGQNPQSPARNRVAVPGARLHEASGLEPVREIRAAGSGAKKPGTPPGFWTPLAAVAALLIIFLGFKFWGADSSQATPHALGWSTQGDVGGVQWAIDGTPVEASESAQQIAKRLDAARSVAALGGGKLRLSYGRLFQVEISEGSELDLSAFRGSKSASDFHLAMGGDSGGFCFQTGPEFKRAGCELTFQTPEAQIAVAGTVFSVDRFPIDSAMAGTCICCAEGSVQVKATHEREISTVAGKSCFVVPGDTELISANVEHDHMTPMKDLIDAVPPSLWLD